MTNGHGVKPVWLVKPSDKRRKDEDIAEAMLGKIITAEEATFNRAPKLKPPKTGGSSGTGSGGRGPVSPSSSNTQTSDGSVDGGKKYSPSRGDAGSKPAGVVRGKRKSEESDETSGIDRVKKTKRNVTFVSQESNTTTTTNGSRKKPVSKVTPKIAKKVKSTTRIGTRSSGEIAIMPELPPPVKRSKIIKKVKSVKKEEAYKVVKMLTGTLYIYRGDRPRAEFIRFK